MLLYMYGPGSVLALCGPSGRRRFGIGPAHGTEGWWLVARQALDVPLQMRGPHSAAIDHIGLGVEDLAEAAESLRAKGAQVATFGPRIGFVTCPDGVRCELVEVGVAGLHEQQLQEGVAQLGQLPPK